MEYLEGETLADRLRKGPLSIEQVLRYANRHMRGTSTRPTVAA